MLSQAIEFRESRKFGECRELGNLAQPRGSIELGKAKLAGLQKQFAETICRNEDKWIKM